MACTMGCSEASSTPAAAPKPPAERPQLTVREQLNGLRKELNTLVALHNHRTKKPHGTPTFLVDGSVAGAWRYDDRKVELEPWTRLDRATRTALDDEAERLAAVRA